MLFYTPEFLAFSLVLLGTLGFVHRDTPRKLVLLVASYVFYMWWNPAFIALIVFATAVNFVVSARIARTERESTRKALLAAGLVASLGLLAYFKYAGFLSDNLLYALQAMGFEVHWTSLHVVLPVGISFYTFQTLSYTFDVYRRNIEPSESPLDFALFVAFFPQLVAGPIVRAADFMPQLLRAGSAPLRSADAVDADRAGTRQEGADRGQHRRPRQTVCSLHPTRSRAGAVTSGSEPSRSPSRSIATSRATPTSRSASQDSSDSRFR